MGNRTSNEQSLFTIPGWLTEKFCWDYYSSYVDFEKYNNTKFLHGNHVNYYYKGVNDGKTALLMWGYSRWYVGRDGLEKITRINYHDEICTSPLVFREYQYGHYPSWEGWKEYIQRDDNNKPTGRFVYKSEGDGVCWLKAPGLWFSKNSIHRIAFITEHYESGSWSDSH